MVDLTRVSYSSAVFFVSTLVKVLMFPLYKSTDFEVHRNWMAVTRTLPLRDWYSDETSQWTLDYPPFFAWFERLLSVFARMVDPAMVTLQSEPFESSATVYFQRTTVIVGDLMLFWALRQFCYTVPEHHKMGLLVLDPHVMVGKQQTRRRTTSATSPPASRTAAQQWAELCVLVMAFVNPGLLLVDHIHFQYNGFLLGIFIWSLTCIARGDDLQGAILFAVVLNFKHIFLYVAPLYFVYLLLHYCCEPVQGEFRGYQQFEETSSEIRWRFRPGRFIWLGSCVAAVFALSFVPFIVEGQFGQVMSRLFPFKRGLCHAYWAPNFWALYNAFDMSLVIVVRKAVGIDLRAPGPGLTSGLVTDVEHSVLPSIAPAATMLLTLAAMAPVLWNVARRPHPRLFLSAAMYCLMCSFMLGWHVHEKAILMVTVPLGMCACDNLLASKLFLFLNTIGTYALFPLLHEPQETPVKICLLLLHTAVSTQLLRRQRQLVQAGRRITAGPIVSSMEQAYLLLLLPLQLFVSVIHPLFLSRFEFLPLLMTSTYCSIGTAYSWFLLFKLHTRQDMLLASYQGGKEE